MSNIPPVQPPNEGHSPYPHEVPVVKPTDSVPQFLIPTRVDGVALAAGYMGLFALIPIFAPIALILGVVALRRLKAHPERTGTGRAWFAVIIGALMTIVLLLIVGNAMARSGSG